MSAAYADLQRFHRHDADTREYRLAIITDEDHASRVELDDGQVAWQSTLRYDRLFRHTDGPGRVRYELEEVPADQGGEHQLISLIAEGGRGAEFSELTLFGGKLLTFDDRTGLVCEVRHEHQLIPRHILMTGSGDEAFKGFKSEWATLKDDQLIVGSHGKLRSEKWVKWLDRDYRLISRDWHGPYQRMMAAVGVDPEHGYVVHEAAEWHPLYRQWLFFPRKISTETFDEAVDERERGANTLIIADEDFDTIHTLEVGERVPERGVSSFKILPGHPNECIGLKSVEIDDQTETWLFCFDLDGNILQEDTFLGYYKCEGVEVL